ncbi:MAG: hypothetical protein GXY26_03815 [Clostridiales bacterium]|nr:hypothetical protein [Clostridiales bacterium]
MNRRKGVAVGAVSLVLIFSILCLTIFTLLTLGTARSEANLARCAADSVKSFYAADTEAERVYSELVGAVLGGKLPRTVRGTHIEYSDGYIGFICPLSDNRSISVLILADGTIVQWRETDDENWTPDESLRVWGGE